MEETETPEVASSPEETTAEPVETTEDETPAEDKPAEAE